MNMYAKILLLFMLISLQQAAFAYKEITGILDQANDLTPEELNALRPLFNDMQSQYDYVVSEAAQDGNDEANADPEFDALYATTRREFLQHFDGLLRRQQVPSIVYDTNLPTVTELIGHPSDEMTSEQLGEYLDMQSILEESLDEAQTNINAIVKQALQMESNLLKLNKPKIVEYLYDALSVLFGLSVRGRRAAYCTYSHIPQLNTSLHNLYDGIDCYTYTTALIVRIQNETVQTVGTIKKNVFDLANVYKKIAAKNSILGKILSGILSVTKIARAIRDSIAAATKAINDLQQELPQAALKAANCGVDFALTLPHMVESVANVTTCILFVDNTTEDWDFMKPEAVRDLD